MLAQIFNLLGTALDIYGYALIIYILMSWFPGARESSFGIFLSRIAEPYLEQFRKIIPPIGMIDLSPLVGLIVLRFASGQGLPVLYRMLQGWF